MTATIDEAPASAVPEIPSFEVTLKVRRYTPESEHGEEAYWDEFTVTAHGTDRVSTPLHKIKWSTTGQSPSAARAPTGSAALTPCASTGATVWPARRSSRTSTPTSRSSSSPSRACR